MGPAPPWLRAGTESPTQPHLVAPRGGQGASGGRCGTGRALPGLPTPRAGQATSLKCPGQEGLPCTAAVLQALPLAAKLGLPKLHPMLYLQWSLPQVLWAHPPAQILPRL